MCHSFLVLDNCSVVPVICIQNADTKWSFPHPVTWNMALLCNISNICYYLHFPEMHGSFPLSHRTFMLAHLMHFNSDVHHQWCINFQFFFPLQYILLIGRSNSHQASWEMLSVQRDQKNPILNLFPVLEWPVKMLTSWSSIKSKHLISMECKMTRNSFHTLCTYSNKTIIMWSQSNF